MKEKHAASKISRQHLVKARLVKSKDSTSDDKSLDFTSRETKNLFHTATGLLSLTRPLTRDISNTCFNSFNSRHLLSYCTLSFICSLRMSSYFLFVSSARFAAFFSSLNEEKHGFSLYLAGSMEFHVLCLVD